jgi:phage gp36-like protein
MQRLPYQIRPCSHIRYSRPTARNKKLLSVAKDVATWHLIRLANVNMEYELRRQFYEDAIDWLQAVQAGKIDALLPILVIPPNQTPQGNGIKWGSNTKRSNHM